MRLTKALLTVMAIVVGLGVFSAHAEEDWRIKYPVIHFSTSTGENEADRIARYTPFEKYLEKTLGVPVEFYVASDYAGAIEGMKARKVQFVSLGSAGYSAAYAVTKGECQPLVTQIDSYNSSGYHSVICVKSDSPYKTIDDLKGKSIAFADPNSTSGFLIPTYYLRKLGYSPDDTSFFGKTGFSGSHEMGVLAVKKGTYDACCTWYTNKERSNPKRMAGKGMIQWNEEDPSKSDVRIIWKSPLIPNGPWTCRKELPKALKEAFINAMIDLPKADPDAFQKLGDGKLSGFKRVPHERYLDIIEMRSQNLKKRKS
jgi:phosphonate transport system substrate-binding protein